MRMHSGLEQSHKSTARRLQDDIIPRARKLLRLLLLYSALVALCAFVLLPVSWMLTVALKPDNVPFYSIPPQWFPTEHFEWRNFETALLDPVRPFLRFTLNTLIIFGGNVIGTIFSCTLVAYAFARLRFRGSGFLFNVLIITMLIPWQSQMIPQFCFSLNWAGTGPTCP